MAVHKIILDANDLKILLAGAVVKLQHVSLDNMFIHIVLEDNVIKRLNTTYDLEALVMSRGPTLPCED
jgi:hypothetical protein